MLFKRHLYAELEKELKRPEICYVFGARQVGKTTLLKNLLSKIPPKKKYSYFNLEVPADLAMFNKTDAEIFDLLKNSGDYIFIDEFHYIENASSLFKAIYDSDFGIKIFASGSSAIEMHKHLKESLAGRVNSYLLKPLDIFEMLDTETISNKTFAKIFAYGLLPGTYVDKNQKERAVDQRKQYLNSILETYIQRDVKSLVIEENLRAFNNLLFILADNQGQILPSSNLANELMIGRATVDRYLDILEQTFVLYPLQSFASNLSNELKKSRKYYLYDLGLMNALLKDFSDYQQRDSEKDCFWESFVYYYLLNRQCVESEIFFWRTSSNNEVDFIWRKNRQLTAIEAKSKISKQIPSGLKSFLRAYPKTKQAVVLNEDHDTEMKYKDHVVKFISYKNMRKLDEYLS